MKPLLLLLLAAPPTAPRTKLLTAPVTRYPRMMKRVQKTCHGSLFWINTVYFFVYIKTKNWQTTKRSKYNNKSIKYIRMPCFVLACFHGTHWVFFPQEGGGVTSPSPGRSSAVFVWFFVYIWDFGSNGWLVGLPDWLLHQITIARVSHQRTMELQQPNICNVIMSGLWKQPVPKHKRGI